MKEYTVVRDARAALDLVRATRDSAGVAHFYEHMADAPCTLYFDIDAKVDRARRDEVLEANVEWIRLLLGELGHEVAREDMRVLDGTREGKVSFHVLVPRLVLLGDAHRAKIQAAIRRALERRPSDVDAAPYRRNALLRTPYSSKFGTNAPLLPVSVGPVGPYDNGPSVVGALGPSDNGALGPSDNGPVGPSVVGPNGPSVDGPNGSLGPSDDAEYMARSVRADAVPVFAVDDGSSNSSSNYANNNNNSNVVEEEIDDELAEKVAEAVRETGDARSVYSARSSDPSRRKYYFLTRGTRVCLATGRTHESNNFEVHVTPSGEMWYRCLSEHCVGTRRLLGSVAPTTRITATGNTMWSGAETYASRWTRPFELGDRCVMMLRAEMGTGKTHQLREYLRTCRPARVLLVAFRISLCEYFGEYLSEFGFVMYNDERYRETLGAQPRVIVTVNSLFRLVGSEYDDVVLDEVEGIMEQFDAVHPAQRRGSWMVFEKLVRDTPRVLCLDAALGERAHSVVSGIRRDVRVVVNEHRTATTRVVVVQRRDKFFSTMLERLGSGRRVVLASTSAAQLIAVYDAVTRAFPEKRMYLIHAGTPEREKARFAASCNEFLPEYDGLFYSPTIQAGNSIDVPFDELFVYATRSGPTPEAVHQMIGRVRTFHSPHVCVTFDTTPSEPSHEYNYEEIVEHMSNPLVRASEGVEAAYATDWRVEFSRSPLFALSVWNTMYRVNGFNNFVARFLRICTEKGYTVHSVPASEEGDVSAGAAVRQEVHMRAVASREEHYAAVVDAQKLTHAQYARMRQALRVPSASDDVALAVERYEFCAWYDVGHDALTVDMMRRHSRQAHKGAYHRMCLMLPADGARDGASVMRRIEDVMRTEGTRISTAPDAVYACSNLPRSNGVRLLLVHQLIRDLGFDSAFDTTRLAAADLEARCGELREHLAEYKSQVDAAFLVQCSKRRPVAEWDAREIRAYVNQCIRPFVGVSVRKLRGGQYGIVGTGAWDGGVKLHSAALDSWDIFY
jgi:hypothetical protein